MPASAASRANRARLPRESGRARRFAARLAIVFALFLAVAEVVRNWGGREWWPFWLVDYLAVGLLLAGGLSVSRGRAAGAPLLSGAWGFTVAMFYMGFFSHLERLRADPSSPGGGPLSHARLTSAIGVLFAVAVGGLVTSLLPARDRPEATGES